MFFGSHEFKFPRGILLFFIVFAVGATGVYLTSFYFARFASSSEPTTPLTASIFTMDREAVAEEFSGESCDIFVTMPNKQLKYFDTVDCAELGNIESIRDQLFDFSGEQMGEYTVTIFSDRIRTEKVFHY